MARAPSKPLVSLGDLPFRPCVGITLFNKNGEVFIGHRLGLSSKNGDSPWQMPQGGIDSGEDPLVAAKRELREETNISSVHLLATAEDWLTYEFPPEVATKVLNGRFRGQRQLWFAMLFAGEQSEIDVSRPDDGKHKPEFSRWRWQSLEKLPDIVVPFKHDLYLQIVHWFRDIPEKIASGDIPQPSPV